MDNKYYITTAIVYASAKPHIGNAYDPVLADSIARYERMKGKDVFYLTGTDEHGQKIELKANEANISPKEYVDKVSSEVKRVYDLLNISYDRFIRTTDSDHVNLCEKVFKKLYEQGDIYKDIYEGWYCTPCESFFTDSQLIDGKCPDCGREVTKEKEEAYFFRMSKYADKLIKYINENDLILPESRKNEMLNNFLLPGLKDLCVTRSNYTWGIKTGLDDKHIIYVWLDALFNYLTGIGYDTENPSKDFYKYWPCDLHVIGKDIVRFHSIYWTIFLMALDLPLPKKILGHPWLLSKSVDDEILKMSKSRGNVLYPDELVNIFGVDGVRFYLLSEMPYENDGVINIKLITEKYNSDLANVYGNLVSRTISMINKYQNGLIAKCDKKIQLDVELKNEFELRYNQFIKFMDGYKIGDAINELMQMLKRLNKYIDETEPWILAKDEDKKDLLKDVLYNLSEYIIKTSYLLYPFIPYTVDSIFDQFNVNINDIKFDNIINYELNDQIKVTENKINLFERKEYDKVLEEFDNNGK